MEHIHDRIREGRRPGNPRHSEHREPAVGERVAPPRDQRIEEEHHDYERQDRRRYRHGTVEPSRGEHPCTGTQPEECQRLVPAGAQRSVELNEPCQHDHPDEYGKRLTAHEQRPEQKGHEHQPGEHPSAKIRELSALALGETKAKRNKQLVAALLKALEEPKASVRTAAAKAFVKIRIYEAIEPLMAALDDPSKDVARAAHDALKSITHYTWPQRRAAWEDWWKGDKKKFYVREE